MFYHYGQNNSGGSFHFDADKGITHHVVIEAKTCQEANEKAETIGIYFDGEDDCPCCGVRWEQHYDESDATKEPEVYGQKVTQDWKPMWGLRWMGKNPEVFIHYLDGTIQAVQG